MSDLSEQANCALRHGSLEVGPWLEQWSWYALVACLLGRFGSLGQHSGDPRETLSSVDDRG